MFGTRRAASDEPIITSLLDADFYKFTMGQFVFHRYHDVPVRYGFKNRTSSVPLGKIVDIGQLREELDHVRQLSVGKSELHYLRGTNEYSERMFREDYLSYLSSLVLPRYQLTPGDEQFCLEFPGAWEFAIYWETIALSIINELYTRAQMAGCSRGEQDAVYAEGVRRLMEKVGILKAHPEITFCDFGTRRRFSGAWQRYVNEILAEELPGQFLGTSNTKFAMDLGLLPMGTNAHEQDMVLAALNAHSDDALRSAHNQLLQEWWNEYGYGLSIALTDTFGTEFFFRDMTREQAAAWKGLRQDSGDPAEFGERAIRFYEAYGIDPKEKLLIFSDGLELPQILRLVEQFHGRIKVTFGWGTNLTNDLGIRTLSLVVKVIEANGVPTVKLSDNLAKATGSAEDVARYKRAFGHTIDTYVECRV